ncbi:MAG: class I SAM-dependent methyltransferase [Candidatus Binatia bacterium]
MIAYAIMTGTTSWNPHVYAKNARFVSDLGEPLLQLLRPQAHEFILDLGCGDGALTARIAEYGSHVVGLDSSFPQLQAARARGIQVIAMDSHHLCFERRFDAVFTNAALHWMNPLETVIAGVANSLKQGGRFVGEFGGKSNVETIRLALHSALRRRGIDPLLIDPWYYPATEEYSQLLSNEGFTVNYIELLTRPTKLPGDIGSWMEVFAQAFILAVPALHREEFLAEVCNALQSDLRDTDGSWIADYVRLRFKAVKTNRF